MKKYTKILGIVLCFALLIGILPLTAAADPEPTTWLDLIPESTIESIAGYYVDGDMDTLTDEDPDEGAYLTDAHMATAGWMHGGDWPAPDGAIPAVVFELDATKTVGAMELIARQNYGLTDYTIQANTTNGWESVQNVVTTNHGNTQFVTFDAVECDQVRILISTWVGDHPMLQEVSIYESKTTTPLVQIPVAGVECDKPPVTNEFPAANVIDGDRYTIYQVGNGNTPVQFTFNTTNTDGSANNFSRMTIFAFRADKSTVADFTVEVQGEPNGTWTQVHTGTAYAVGHTDTFVLDLAQSYKAYAVRLTVVSTTGEGLCLPEVRLYGSGETYEAPTAPTEPPTEPTAPTEPSQPTAPTGTAVPEAPVVTPGATTIENGITVDGTVYKKLNNSTLSAEFGYYSDGTGADESTFVDGNDGSCVIDGWYGRAGYSECSTSQGQMALILTSSETKNIGAITVMGRGGYYDNVPEQFEVQAMVDGSWVTVLNVTENAFTESYTVNFTFPAIETNQIRMLIHKVAGGSSTHCYLDEVELYEVTTGKLYNDIDLTGKLGENNAFGNNPATNLIDGDKTSNTSGSNYTINLTGAEGNPTSIDGFRMYLHRGDRTELTTTVNIMIQETVGGDFVSIGSFSTGWVKNAQNEICLVEFDKTYVAYAVKLNCDSNAPNHEFELFQYQKDEAPVPPPGQDPTNPTDPTQGTEPAPTQGTEPAPSGPAPTQGTEPAPTQGTEPAPTQGTEPAPTQGTEPAPTQGTEPAPSEPAPTLPELPDLPATPDTEQLFGTIKTISNLKPAEYTAESYAALVEAAETVNAMISAAGGVYTQEMLDEMDAILTAALAGLVKIDGGNTDNGPDNGGNPDNDPNNGGTGPDDESDPNPDTGDVAFTVLGAMMTLSAMGGAVVIGKKKLF